MMTVVMITINCYHDKYYYDSDHESDNNVDFADGKLHFFKMQMLSRRLVSH